MDDPEVDECGPDTSDSVVWKNAIVPVVAVHCIARLAPVSVRVQIVRAFPVLWYGSAGLALTKMKSLILRYCIAVLLALLLGVAPLRAAPVADLFQSEVDAAGRDTAARDAALAQALQEVLVRVTGSARAVQQGGARALLQQPGRFVEQYRFEELAGAGGQPQLRLWVQFDGVALAREIRAAGLSYWGSERPDVLLWLAVDDRGRRYLVSEASDSEGADAVTRAARLHGLPVTLPLMDLEDQRALQFTDVWGGFMGAVESASQRYRPQVVLVGKLDSSGAGGSWRGSWNLLAAGASQGWSGHAADMYAAVQQGIARATESLADQYAVADARSSVRALTVEDVRGVEDYARVYRYLASLTPVDQVQVARVTGQEVQFDLTLSAEERSLLQVITLGRVLQAAQDPLAWRFRLRH